MRLIDADSLANEICKVKRTDNWLGAILVAIQNAPTIEPTDTDLIIKICDVVDSCEECPRYGDDCDGGKKDD